MRLALMALWMMLPAAHAQTADAWKKLDFLLGNWTGVAGEKDTPIGAGQGAFSFEPELNRKIVVRRNNASYDSGVQHDDLMVIYLDSPNVTPRAIYFDSEGHVIRYNLAFPSADRAVFESEASGAGPKYRLTYWLEGAMLHGRFEVGAGSSEYKAYMNWTAKRR